MSVYSINVAGSGGNNLLGCRTVRVAQWPEGRDRAILGSVPERFEEAARPYAPSLTVLVPVYNERSWIEETLRIVADDVRSSGWTEPEIVVVDDGSSDGTADILDRLAAELPLKVIHQPNRGRFAARAAALRQGRGDFVLLLDARVHVNRGSLSFALKQVLTHPDRRVWNGDVAVQTRGNPYAAFWSAIATLVWHRYFRNRRLTSYGSDDFDAFPKGTGMFLAPRGMLIEGAAGFTSLFDDTRLASDDTRLIRSIAEKSRINLAPEFGCRYHGRDSFGRFVRQAYFRGTTFVDSYLGAPGPLSIALRAGLASTPALLVVTARRPRGTAASVAMASAGLSAAAHWAGAPVRDSVAMGVLAPVFAAAFGAGVVRGLAVAARTRYGDGMARPPLADREPIIGRPPPAGK